MKQFGIGQPVRRVEDRRFITGCGTYLDDIERARQAYAFMLRSPYAHARVRAVDTDVAVAVPGVLGVLTGEDLARDGLGTIPCLSAVTNRDQSPSVIPPHPAMAPTACGMSVTRWRWSWRRASPPRAMPPS